MDIMNAENQQQNTESNRKPARCSSNENRRSPNSFKPEELQEQRNSQPQICECTDFWRWDNCNKSHEVKVQGENGQTAFFHPNWSNGTAAIRGDKVLNGGIYYWEIKLSQRVFGTSMMFGIGTAKTRLHVDAFVNLLGEDSNSMGISHKGLAWCNGAWRQYTKAFRENEPATVGMLFNGYEGTLTYFKDGESLGIAFTGLNSISENLYPIITSTAAKTDMTLTNCRRCFISLQDRCRRAILDSIRNIERRDTTLLIENLPIPRDSIEFIMEEVERADTSMTL